MQLKTLRSAVVLSGIVLAVACSDAATAPTLAPPSAAADKAADAGGSSLFFNGSDANASTPLGSIVTTQIDNLTLSATVRFDGPNANQFGDDHQMIVYNGHGAVSGWGILVLGSGQGFADGTISILAGGILVAVTPFILPQGQWVDVSATRTDGNVTVTMGDQSYDLGFIPVTPVGDVWAGIERTSVGGDGTFNAPTGDFHGGIKRVDIRSGNHFIEKWRFAGHGNTSTGINGTVLNLGTATWEHGNQ